MTSDLDRLDVAVLRMVVQQPRAGVREYARQLGVARGTVQARLDRLQRTGVLASYRPHIAPAAMGFAGLAYIHLNLAQGMLDETSRRLAAIPEKIRGFGPVKMRHLKAAKADEAALLEQFRAGVPPLLKAAE